LNWLILKEDDYIFIPSAMNKEVYVLGNVKAPGHFLFKEKMSLLMAVAFAGGRSSFACSQAIILRGNFEFYSIRLGCKANI